jgi:hypothetical protein
VDSLATPKWDGIGFGSLGGFAQNGSARCEAGSPSSLHLNFSIFCISIGMSFLIALLTAAVSDRIFIVFVILTVAVFLLGSLLFILWYRARRSIAGVVRRIRARIPGSTISSPGEQTEAPQ